MYVFTFYTQIVSEAAQLEGRALSLRQQIESLWTRLNVPQEDQLAFNESHQGHKPKVITKVNLKVLLKHTFD